MSATVDTSTDWGAEAYRLRRDQKMTTKDLAEMFGKSESQVRRVIAQASTERHVNGAEPTVKPDENGAEVRSADAWEEPQGDITRAVEKPDDPLHAFKAEAGESVGDMPPGPPAPDPEEPETRVKGTRQTCIDFGPDADLPTGGFLVVKSEKLASGHFHMGDLVRGSFVARITDVGGKERFDKASEEYRAKPTAYVATMTEVDWDTD